MSSTHPLRAPARLAALVPLLSLLTLTLQPAEPSANEMPAAGLSAAHRALLSQAVQSFREQRHAAAYGRFVQLADAGHVPSARLAMLMHENGAALFGSDWSATPAQQRRWNALIVNGARNRLDFADNERGD